jgi:hypothetical protein
MAAIKKLEPPFCEFGDCAKRATHSLLTFRERVYGVYCLTHARNRRNAMDQYEQAIIKETSRR